MQKHCFFILSIFITGFALSCTNPKAPANDKATRSDEIAKNNEDESSDKNVIIISHIVNIKKNKLKFYWKDKNESNFKNFKILKNHINKKDKNLIFAMNADMYKKDLSPLGLYIEDGKVLAKINRVAKAYGNFYLQPNGIFYLTKDGTASICKTTAFEKQDNIQYATQSGPLLLIDGAIHPKLTKGSKSLHIRNGVGILPNGNVIFAISKEKINFYDFATFFKAQGCKNALYLDGFVSRMYLPSQNWEQLDGDFGVIIGQEGA